MHIYIHIKSLLEFISTCEELYWFIEYVPCVSRSLSSTPLIVENPSWSLGSGGHEFIS